MKKNVCVLLVLVIFLLTTGCGKRGERTAQLEDYKSHEEAQLSDNYVSGDWGEKFVRSNGHTYPFVFDAPIAQCMGFTLDYEIVEIVEGNLNGNFRYEVYVRQTNGKWKSVELFQMDGNSLSVDVRFDKAIDIDAVAVVCGKKGNASFSYSIGVRDVKYV